MKLLVKKSIFDEKLNKYVVDYEVEGDYIKVLANNGDYRIVKNTEKNITILNQTIIKNKINIAKKIDAYEKSSTERLILFFITTFLLIGCGILIPFSFFTGSYLLFISSIIVFGISVVLATLSAFNLYILIKDVKSLKKATGYKKGHEFSFRRINVKSLKSHN